MIDVTDYLLEPGAEDKRFDQMIDWCEHNIGMSSGMSTDGVYHGAGWKAGVRRDPDKKGLRYYFDFDSDLDELQFKIVWSALTFQTSAQASSAPGAKQT